MKFKVDAPDDSMIRGSKDRYSDMGVVSTDDKVDAAQDLIDAMKDGDAKAVALAFERMLECCDSEPDEDD